MDSQGQTIAGLSSPTVSPTRDQVEDQQIKQWLSHPVTRLVLHKLRVNQLYHLRRAASLANQPGANDLTLRLALTRASTMETTINKIEKGDLAEDSSLI